MPPEHSDEARRRGRPAGFVLPAHGKGPARGAAGAVPARRMRADPALVAVTPEALAALHPRRAVDGLTRVLAVLLAGMRHQAGWTQKELARACRVSFQEIGQLERGEHDVGVVTLGRICEALGTEPWRVLQVAADAVRRECLLS